LAALVAAPAAEADTATCVSHEAAIFGGVTASIFRFGTTA